MRRLLVVLSLFAPALAAAVPLQVAHQGRLADSAGVPLDGAHQLTFSLYESGSSTLPVWTDTLSTNLDNGHFSVVLGASPGNPLDHTVLDGALRFLAIGIDGGPELPDRLALVSVPYAIRAGEAETVRGGVVDASELRVNGTVIVDSSGTLSAAVAWGDLTGVPPSVADGDADTLGALACTVGHTVLWDGSAWACGIPATGGVDAASLTGTVPVSALPVGTSADTVSAGDHTHGFGQITGQAAFGQLPVGAGPNQVAAGDHAHGFAQITGQAAIAQLPVGSAANQVAAGNHTHAFSQITGAVAANQLPADLVATGRVQVGASTATCATATAGSLRWTGTALELCTGTTWRAIDEVGPTGGSASDPGTSCLTLHTDDPSLPSGPYWIDPDGNGSNAAFRVYCDMTTDGGGWTLVGLTNSATELSAPNLLADVSDPGVGNYVKPLRGLTGTDTRYECGATGTGVLGFQFTTGTWDWRPALLQATQAAPYNENITWRVMVPGYNPPGSEAANPWGNHVGGVHYPNFGYTGFSAIDGRIFRQGVFTCDPQNSVYGTGDVAWASTVGTRFVRYWLR